MSRVSAGLTSLAGANRVRIISPPWEPRDHKTAAGSGSRACIAHSLPGPSYKGDRTTNSSANSSSKTCCAGSGRERRRAQDASRRRNQATLRHADAHKARGPRSARITGNEETEGSDASQHKFPRAHWQTSPENPHKIQSSPSCEASPKQRDAKERAMGQAKKRPRPLDLCRATRKAA